METNSWWSEWIAFFARSIRLGMTSVFFWGVATSAFAAIEIGPENSYALSAEMEYLAWEADQASTPAELLIQTANGDWRAGTGGAVNLLYLDKAVWIRVAIDFQDAADKRWWLELGWPFLDRVDAWWLVARDAPEKVVYLGSSGDHVPVGSRALQHRFALLPMEGLTGQQGQLYVRVQSTSSVILDPVLWNADTFFVKEMQLQLLLGSFLGIMLIMGLYNLGIWLFVREPAYGYYVGYTFSATVYMTTLTGLGSQYLWSESIWAADRMLALTAVMTYLLATRFVWHFLDLKNNNPIAARLIDHASGFYAFALVLALLIPEHHLAAAGQVAGLVMVGGALIIGIWEWRSGNLNARYFTLAWSILILGTSIYILMLAGYLPQNLFTESVQSIGFVAEVVLLSFALGERMNRMGQAASSATEMSLHLSRELNRAHEERIRSQDDLNLRLEAEVKARTRDLEQALINLSEANQRLAELSETDQLTSLYNRRYFDRHIAEELRRCYRNQQPIAILVLDLDHFKQINDQHGHLFGDECLRRVARVIRKHTQRPGDTAVRFGGEEFVVLLPGTSREGATQVSELIREDVQNLVVENGQKPVWLTISIGISGRVPAEGDTSEKLLEEADAALYRAKEAGRNRIEIHSWQ